MANVLKNIKYSYYFLMCVVFMFASCHTRNSEVHSLEMKGIAGSYNFPYDLTDPDEKYTLPSVLYEISGIEVYKNAIACIQDEKGIVFIYDPNKKEIVSEIKFGDEGDYEDIELVDDNLFVLKSNGNLYRFTENDHDEVSAEKIKTPLKSSNDCEGLCYDSLTHSLWIACKGTPSLKDRNIDKKYRAVYSYSLQENSFNMDPVLLVDVEQVHETLDLGTYLEISYSLANKFSMKGGMTFQPSGIAIHPISGDIYLIANVGKLLLVYNRKGDLLHIQPLNRNLFRQPEGICFDGAGNLYISSEGSGGKGYILIFKLKP